MSTYLIVELADDLLVVGVRVRKPTVADAAMRGVVVGCDMPARGVRVAVVVPQNARAQVAGTIVEVRSRLISNSNPSVLTQHP